jgi:hypothetical protein
MLPDGSFLGFGVDGGSGAFLDAASPPSATDGRAKDPMCAMSASGTAAGSPIPILMVPIAGNSFRPVLNETDTGPA